MPIETERLLLRRFTAGDGDAFFAYMGLEEVARYENFDPMTREECREEAAERAGMENRLAVELKGGGMIGDLGWEELDFDTYVFSYDFHPKWGGKGYATEACRALISYLFRERGARRVWAETNAENLPSIRLLERLGFRREGLFREDVSFKEDAEGKPIFQSTCYYAMLRDEYK
jgi:RimJ/RimL family protein N-acetyltransferase